MHPTRERLLLTTVEIIDEGNGKIHVDGVLQRSGISKGSLYHHFVDLQDLVDAATVFRFSRMIEADIAGLQELLKRCQSREDLRSEIRMFNQILVQPDRVPNRLERARIIGECGSNPRLEEAISVEQARLTESLADLFRMAIEKGWIDSKIDPRAAASITQGVILGRTVDDVSGDPVTADAWLALVNDMYDAYFFGNVS